MYGLVLSVSLKQKVSISFSSQQTALSALCSCCDLRNSYPKAY